jgi:hypothetical protein
LPSIEGKHDGRSILLDVAILAARDPMDITHRVYTGLLDTGATKSWITPRVINDLQLSELGKETVSVATEERLVTTHIFRVGLFPPAINSVSMPYVFPEIVGCCLKQTIKFDVLIGMDILSQTDFCLQKDRSWKLQFG